MRLPLRRSERLKIHADEGPLHMTQDGVEKLSRKLKQIEETELPQSIEDVKHTAEFGDFSENAEYQEAKSRMRRLHAQIFTIKEKLKQAMIIKPNTALTGTVQLGSTVILEINGSEKTFFLVGPQEADPTKGRLSYVSPLGAKLMGHQVDDLVIMTTINGETTYRITHISL